MKENFWKGKKVLITGYEGFLGSNMTKKLLERGAIIYGLDIVTYREKTILSSQDIDAITVIKGSVADFELVSKIVNGSSIEYIFHLAAKSIVGECLAAPRDAFSTNIEGTWNILEAARNSKNIKGVIIASSDKAYGDQTKLPYTEDTGLSGQHPYDVSKSCADLISYTYFKTYNLSVSVTRCGNIYGPGDFNFSRIIPDTIRKILTDEELIIRSDGTFTRDYIYVDDVVNAYLLLAENIDELNLSGEAFNFSNENPISVLQLVETVYKLFGNAPRYKILNEAENEIRHQYLSSAKARKILDWQPKYTLEKGLKETIEWYKIGVRS